MLTGTTNRDRVLLVHYRDHIPVFDLTPDAHGFWSADVPLAQPFMAIYMQDGCQPEMHGPYSVDVP